MPPNLAVWTKFNDANTIQCTLNERRWRNDVHLMVFTSLNIVQTAKFGGMLADRNLTSK